MQESELDESLTVVPTQRYVDIHWGMKISLPVEEVMQGPTKVFYLAWHMTGPEELHLEFSNRRPEYSYVQSSTGYASYTDAISVFR